MSDVFNCNENRYNYGNRIALELWELSWQEFTQMPSRKAVRDMERKDCDRLLAAAATKGYIDNYSGIRMDSSPKRFQIENVMLWNVLSKQNQWCGQAAVFSKWKFI